jgi:eukaryotic-like serine/threonine-protein kinase
LYKPGSHIDCWVVDRALGRGGMGTVYRCHNESATRIKAAVKVLEGDINANEDARMRFIREAEILFQLDHPNIVKVRNVRTDAKPAYIEMEFVEGRSLEDAIREGPIPMLQALEYVGQIASAIAYMHGKGVCHRDIKPANLLITDDDRVKLVDFGLAMESDVTRITQHGMAFGTVSYAPPEWITPDKLNPKSWDIYALGVVFHEMLLGKLAFPVSGQGTVRQQAMQVIIGKQNAPPLDPGEAFHHEVRKLIAQMTDKNPAERPETSYIIYRSVQRIQESITGTPSMSPDFFADPLASTKTQTSAPIRSSIPAQPLPSETVTLPPTRASRLMRILAAILLFMVTAGIGIAFGFLLLVPSLLPASRAVQLQIEGVDPATPHTIQLGDRVASRVDGIDHYFQGLEPGEYKVKSVVGPCDLADCPGEECASWCNATSSKVEVLKGSGQQLITLPLDAPAKRPITIALPKTDPKWTPVVLLNDKPSAWDEEAKTFRAEPLLPGPYPLTISLGECEEENLGCHEREDCPPGCRSSQQQAEVPWGAEPLSLTFELPDPVEKPKTRKVVRASPVSKGGLITSGSFARWVGSNPDWLPEVAVAKKRADAGYLSGWTGDKPPPGTSSRPVVNVSGFAAFQYCNAMGKSIPESSAAPTTWAEAPGKPSFEWRRKNNKLVLLDASGQVITNIKMSALNQLTGFRCTR